MTRQKEPPAHRIRPAVVADVIRILSLERSVETAPHWSEADYQNCLEQTENSPIKRQIFVAECAQSLSLLGFAVGKVTDFSGLHPEIEAELESVAVVVEARRLGIGRALCIAVRDWALAQGATSLNLEVRSGSIGPIALYRSLGFTTYATRPAYYRDPVDDATLMGLHLTAPLA